MVRKIRITLKHFSLKTNRNSDNTFCLTLLFNTDELKSFLLVLNSTNYFKICLKSDSEKMRKYSRIKKQMINKTKNLINP